jgi:hypothetical protein
MDTNVLHTNTNVLHMDTNALHTNTNVLHMDTNALHMDTNVLQERATFIFRVAPDDLGIRRIL